MSWNRRSGLFRSALLGCVVIAVLTAACSSSPNRGASSPGANSGSVTGSRTPLPAGRLPSSISKMVCSAKAQTEISEALGETATVTTPTWVGHVYSCRYQYSSGYFTLSVKELSSWNETKGYYSSLGKTLGDTSFLPELGQGGFVTNDGSIVVRKDWKVMLVDISGLPSTFGVPPTNSSDVAYTVADLVMACWAGD